MAISCFIMIIKGNCDDFFCAWISRSAKMEMAVSIFVLSTQNASGAA